MKNTVVCIGELLWDVFPNGRKKIGGSSTNVALHLNLHRLKCLLISGIGDDDDGIELINNLTVQGFSTELIQIKKNLPTSRVVIELDEAGNPNYKIVENVAWDALKLTQNLIKRVEKADALIFCSLTCRTEMSRNTVFALADKARLAVLDLNLRPPFYDIETIKSLLKKANILKMNRIEFDYLIENLNLPENQKEQSLRDLAAAFELKTICLTLGHEGAMLLHEENIYHQKGYKVKVTDTVGAGDAFLASFLAGFLEGKQISNVLETACLMGAFVTSRPGANPYYDEEILNEFRTSIS